MIFTESEETPGSSSESHVKVTTEGQIRLFPEIGSNNFLGVVS